MLSEHNCSTIEDLFALLSSQQEEIKIIRDHFGKGTTVKINEFRTEKYFPQKNKSCFTNLGHGKALILKNAVRFVRNPE